jgi:hypothetical protein
VLTAETDWLNDLNDWRTLHSMAVCTYRENCRFGTKDILSDMYIHHYFSNHHICLSLCAASCVDQMTAFHYLDSFKSLINAFLKLGSTHEASTIKYQGKEASLYFQFLILKNTRKKVLEIQGAIQKTLCHGIRINRLKNL